jgi:hypothetical protein
VAPIRAAGTRCGDDHDTDTGRRDNSTDPVPLLATGGAWAARRHHLGERRARNAA